MWLAEQAPARQLAWDCATGSGQAAFSLTAFFDRVFATDASAEQIRHARTHDNIEYRVEAAERCSLDPCSADLILVAQAYHWFDPDRFLAEVSRVLKPGGLLSIVSYHLLRVTAPVDLVVKSLWGQILDGWWPKERAQVDAGLHGLELPFEEVSAPSFEMSAMWQMGDLLNYLGTWSAVKNFSAAKGTNPLDLIERELANAWGDPHKVQKISWPISLRVVRKPYHSIQHAG